MKSGTFGPFGRVVRVPLDPKLTGERAVNFAHGLADFLLTFVPMRIAQGFTDAEFAAQRTRVTDLITSQGDVLQYGGTGQKEARAALITAFALGAHAEGGITALGIHACIRPHDGCPDPWGQEPRGERGRL
ncbi:hypothetical protein [Embleya sp. MST-111070]|uniref:hypothetical protein n=1 Tax=Embleya sp. MST-111070 TaxID=3398231 RepID=UPI003F73F70E